LGHDPDLTAQVTELASLPDHEVEPAKSALLIARSEYPNLDEALYLRRLDEMAARLKSRIPDTATAIERIEQANRLLFVDEGFRGNRVNYYDPRNSFLNDVLDRKLGIPITLSIVYIEVGRRAGLPVYGIGFPGHFLIGFLAESGRIFVDPFNNGRILTEKQCRDLFVAQFGDLRPSSAFLDPVWPKQMLVRLMRNLKAVYWRTAEELKAFRMIQWILIVDPHAVSELRERALIYDAMGNSDSAVKDLERYLELSPEAEDREDILLMIERLEQNPTRVH